MSYIIVHIPFLCSSMCLLFQTNLHQIHPALCFHVIFLTFVAEAREKLLIKQTMGDETSTPGSKFTYKRDYYKPMYCLHICWTHSVEEELRPRAHTTPADTSSPSSSLSASSSSASSPSSTPESEARSSPLGRPTLSRSALTSSGTFSSSGGHKFERKHFNGPTFCQHCSGCILLFLDVWKKK